MAIFPASPGGLGATPGPGIKQGKKVRSLSGACSVLAEA